MSLHLICDACGDYEIIEAPRTATVARILAAAGYKAKRQKGRQEHYCPSCQTMSDKPKRGAQRCRVCGCTDEMACMTRLGPCYWVERDLCSACVGKKAAKKK